MKSRISYFDKTIFKKNLTRFAPAWGLYTVLMALMLFTQLTDDIRRLGSNLLDHVQMQTALCAFFALLCAQLLFGDLYNTRMCYALHALPLRRETWFCTNVVSGFVFHLIPTLSMALVTGFYIALAEYPGSWAVVPLWLLAVNLQFMCLFGISVLSVFCVGSRFAMAVVWVILNSGSLILGELVDILYTPMYYGVRTNMEPFFLLSPYPKMLEDPFMTVQKITVTDSQWGQSLVDTNILLLGENFTYTFLAAAVGLLLIGGALLLYRRRNLECAGDFLAIKAIEPVFALMYTLAVSTIFYALADFWALLLGLAVGWFTSQMLLRRTVRVFQKKTFASCAAVIGLFLLSLLITSLDPFGIESWIPETEDVESVSLADGHYFYGNNKLTQDQPEVIEAVIAIHRDCLDWHQNGGSYRVGKDILITNADQTEEESVSLTFSYKLKSGRTVNRYYHVRGEENILYVQKLFSSPEVVFGEVLTEEEFLEQNVYVTIRDTHDIEETTVFDKADLLSLYQAILADCEAGTMAQSYTWHDYISHYYRLKFSSDQNIYIYSDCENTLNWLREQGFDVDALIELKNETIVR